MNATTLNTATMVTPWYWGFSAAFSTQVAGATGDFATFVTAADFATFHPPWPRNARADVDRRSSGSALFDLPAGWFCRKSLRFFTEANRPFEKLFDLNIL